MGLLMAYLDNANSYTKLKREVVEERKAFDRATAKTLKPIPMIGKGLRLFPHQAEALAKLQVGGTESILDVGTGGGKTILKLLYALSLMGEGKVKKPLIVVPNGLVGQWLGAIEQFTDGKVNGIAICTDTVNDWGEEDIESTVKSAPPNTIFLATYAFLIKGSYESYMGIEYPSIEWIKHIVNPDFVSLDESQFIRGSGSKRGAAINQFRSAKYKMIGTGTLIVNQATDTVQQVGFLNPRVFGSVKSQ
jgi:SNF2 family DNA or RNA helicase